MGQFSWIYSDTKEQLINNHYADAYLLVPEPFQKKYGKSIHESCYDGYGRFGMYDVYELIAEWNKEIIPTVIKMINEGEWECDGMGELHNLQNFYNGEDISCPLRYLGIILSCYDEDNRRIKYPIKITSKEMEYSQVEPSKSDPNQGWRSNF